jgi:acetylglutamate kinase
MMEAGLEPTFVRGHRVTDAEALRVVVRVLSEEINAGICRRIEALAGRPYPVFRDGRSPLRGRKKLMPVTNEEGEEEKLDLGFVGEVVEVDCEEMMAAAAGGAVLVAPPIAQDDSGQLYNVNADTAAAALAGAVEAEKIVFLSNVHGIMSDPLDPDSLLSTVRESELETMIAHGVIAGGMLPKVAACVHALDAGVRKAHIIDGRLPHSLLLEIFTDKGIGTQIVMGD